VEMLEVLLGVAILITLYVLLTFEVFHRTVTALIMCGIVFSLNIILRFADFHELLGGIDMNTILLLMSMMMLVSILSRTGVFSYIASRILVRLHRNPYLLTAVLTGLTAATSAFIDNVTTVLMIAPVVIEVTRKLGVDPRPLLLAIVFSSNIGGTATLIGDPPNIIIGSIAHLGFMDFIYNLTPIAVVDFILFLLTIRFMYRRWFLSYRKIALELNNLSYGVTVDRGGLIRSLISLAVVITLFTLGDLLKYPPAIPAMVGIAVLLVLMGRRVGMEDVLRDVDWSTLVFFMAMFIVVKGVDELGLMDFIARSVLDVSKSPVVLALLIIWVSATVSAFVDNIPLVMAMIPVVATISKVLPVDAEPLYWALSLGGCLGGNATLVGASANIVVAGIAEKHGYHISFKSFTRYGLPVMLTTVGASSIYLVLRYYLL